MITNTKYSYFIIYITFRVFLSHIGSGNSIVKNNPRVPEKPSNLQRADLNLFVGIISPKKELLLWGDSLFPRSEQLSIWPSVVACF